MGDALEALRIVAVLASPAVPETCQIVWERLGLSGRVRTSGCPRDAAWGGYPGGLTVTKGESLFPRKADRARRAYTDSHLGRLYATRGVAVDDVIAAARAGGVDDDDQRRLRPASRRSRPSRWQRGIPTVFATVGLHPHEAKHGVDTIVRLLDGSRRRRGRRVRPRLLLRPLAARRRSGRRSPRRSQLAHELAAAGDPHPRGVGRHVRHPRRRRACPSGRSSTASPADPTRLDSVSTAGPTCRFSGIVTFKTRQEVHDAAARSCPLDRMLVETDSPYLAPVPHRGRPNRPAWVPLVGACLAEVHGVEVAREQAAPTSGVARRRRSVASLPRRVGPSGRPSVRFALRAPSS